MAAKLRQVAADIGLQIPDEIEIRRIHSWPWQRADGAWSWVAGRPGGIALFGSAVSVATVIAAHKHGKVTAARSGGMLELFVD